MCQGEGEREGEEVGEREKVRIGGGVEDRGRRGGGGGEAKGRRGRGGRKQRGVALKVGEGMGGGNREGWWRKGRVGEGERKRRLG